ncbi:uncharacterized protein F5Z01DRAFT_251637 [Emericellopsis atlantica]|uniref:Sulfotransferase family protein n=1 Tax=Emericellopsis atlantica TaxID=2614577 RepID=A0A9P8CLZ8_9HYPO|nr:uncharacterized protein F5Z01DRAFT_251637 [Emericellopsis atlantica]KAG9252149.1 hypothetical protein F5Z01DRAFT_251637 [Emericellopsis atlantica]
MEGTAKLATMPASETSGPPQVISIGLWRMGTASMAAAYDTIGLRPHHSLDMFDTPEQWALFEKAADATWPQGTASDGTALFTRAQWDDIYGQYGAVTEIGAAFAKQLVEAYPEAKVVVVRRDFDKWWPSFRDGVAAPVFSLQGTFLLYCVLPVIGNRGLAAMRKVLGGFFGANSLAGIERNAKETYDAHFESMKALVPPERLLEYRLGQGWEPLCSFLGKDIPDVEFPFINEADALRERQKREVQEVNAKALAKIRSWVPW